MRASSSSSSSSCSFSCGGCDDDDMSDTANEVFYTPALWLHKRPAHTVARRRDNSHGRNVHVLRNTTTGETKRTTFFEKGMTCLLPQSLPRSTSWRHPWCRLADVAGRPRRGSGAEGEEAVADGEEPRCLLRTRRCRPQQTTSPWESGTPRCRVRPFSHDANMPPNNKMRVYLPAPPGVFPLPQARRPRRDSSSSTATGGVKCLAIPKMVLIFCQSSIAEPERAAATHRRPLRTRAAARRESTSSTATESESAQEEPTRPRASRRRASSSSAFSGAT